MTTSPILIRSMPPEHPRSYADRARLAAAVHELVANFGPTVLAEPTRTRNLLLDHYGVHGHGQRHDIDEFVGAISSEVLSPSHPVATAPTAEPASATARRLATATGLELDDATWTVQLIRGFEGSSGAAAPTVLGTSAPNTSRRLVVESSMLGAATGSPAVSPAGNATVVAGPAPVVPARAMVIGQPPADHALSGGSGDPGGWPRIARLTVGVLVAALVFCAVSIVVVARRDDVGDRNTSTNPDRTSQDGSDDNDEADEEAADEASLDALEARLDDAERQATADAARIAELQAAVDTANAEFAAASAELATATGDLAAAEAALARLEQTMEVDLFAMRPPTGRFDAKGSVQECGGGTCEDTWSIGGAVLQESGQLFLNMEEIAKIPLKVGSGWQLEGQSPVTAPNGLHTCKVDGVVYDIPTDISVWLDPVALDVDPATGAVTVSRYSIAWQTSNGAWSPPNGSGSCKPMVAKYGGNLDFA